MHRSAISNIVDKKENQVYVQELPDESKFYNAYNRRLVEHHVQGHIGKLNEEFDYKTSGRMFVKQEKFEQQDRLII